MLFLLLLFLGSTDTHEYGQSEPQTCHFCLPFWSTCWHLGAACMNQRTAFNGAPTQHNFGACLMTGLKTLFLETSGLTFECCPWNLPKGSLLTLATHFSLITLENSPCFLQHQISSYKAECHRRPVILPKDTHILLMPTAFLFLVLTGNKPLPFRKTVLLL